MSSTYPLTVVTWPHDGLIQVLDATDVRVAVFSIEFLRRGCVCSWAYIQYSLACCVRERGSLYAIGNEERLIEEKGEPTSGFYRYRSQGQ